MAFEKHQNQSKVTLEFSLYDEDNKLLLNKTFTHSEPMDGPGYKAFSKAVSRSIEHILNQLSKVF